MPTDILLLLYKNSNQPAFWASALSIDDGPAINGQAVMVGVTLVPSQHTLLKLGVGAQFSHVLQYQGA